LVYRGVSGGAEGARDLDFSGKKNPVESTHRSGEANDLGKFHHDRSLFSRSLESWLVRDMIPKWPQDSGGQGLQEVGGLNSGW